MGYVIEKSGVSWGERFWIDMPSIGVRGFGNDTRARIFFSKSEAEKAVSSINDEFGCHCYVTSRDELYPPPVNLHSIMNKAIDYGG